MQATEYASSLLELHAEILQDTATGQWEGKLVSSLGKRTGLLLADFHEAAPVEAVVNANSFNTNTARSSRCISVKTI